MTNEDVEDVVAEFIWDPQEYGAIVTHLSHEQMRSPRWRIVMLVVGVMMVWSLTQLASTWLNIGNHPGLLLGLIPWTLFGLFWFWILRGGGGGHLAARRAMKIDPRVDRLQRHVISADGISVDTGTGSMALPWSGMSKVAETDTHFLWYWTPQTAHYTPKHVLTETQVEATRDLIRLHAPDRFQRLLS